MLLSFTHENDFVNHKTKAFIHENAFVNHKTKACIKQVKNHTALPSDIARTI